jgi:hypothetical protein
MCQSTGIYWSASVPSVVLPVDGGHRLTEEENASILLRPGVAAVASRLPTAQMLCGASEASPECLSCTRNLELPEGTFPGPPRDDSVGVGRPLWGRGGASVIWLGFFYYPLTMCLTSCGILCNEPRSL